MTTDDWARAASLAYEVVHGDINEVDCAMQSIPVVMWPAQRSLVESSWLVMNLEASATSGGLG